MFGDQNRIRRVNPTKSEDMDSSFREEETRSVEKVDDQPNSNTAFFKRPESFATFMGGTTLHGARFLFEGSAFGRLLWLAALCVSFGCCMYQFHTMMECFFRWPFSTQIITIDNNVLAFPTVTLCNFNPLNTRRYKMARAQNPNRTKERLDQEILAMANLFTLKYDPSRKSLGLLGDFVFDRNRKFATMYSQELSHQIEEMLLPADLTPCTLSGVHCDARNFTNFTNFLYGQCYSINSGQYSSLIMTTRPGTRDGLRLLLNIEQASYIPSLRNPVVGLKVLVHDQTMSPDAIVEDFGFAVEPGKHSLCAIKKKEVSV